MPGFMTQDLESSGDNENFNFIPQEQQPRAPWRQQDGPIVR